jgi:hypothetical protein
MRAFRISGCWLLVPALLGILGCGRRVPLIKNALPVNYPLTINADCTVTPDWQPVHIGDSVTWSDPDHGHTYSVQFHGGNTPLSTSVVNLGKPQSVTGGTQCSKPATTNPTLCYFPYDVFRDGARCGDPGVHVVPQ